MASSNGEYMGEASYRRAAIRFEMHDLDGAEKIIETVVNNPGSDYWLAKSFILWADIFHQRDNDVQARQTLQSIIDNYEVVNDSDEEVVSEARQHLALLDAPTADTPDTSESNSGTLGSDNDLTIDLDEEE